MNNLDIKDLLRKIKGAEPERWENLVVDSSNLVCEPLIMDEKGIRVIGNNILNKIRKREISFIPDEVSCLVIQGKEDEHNLIFQSWNNFTRVNVFYDYEIEFLYKFLKSKKYEELKMINKL